MAYKKGDVVSLISYGSQKKLNYAIILQADWFNAGEPPSYIISILSSNVYPELDFRPIIEPDHINCLPVQYQAMVDQIDTINSNQILEKTGQLKRGQIKRINGCIKSLLNV